VKEIIMAEEQQQSHEAPDVHDVFDVSNTTSSERLDVDVDVDVSDVGEPMTSEAGILTAPPVPDSTSAYGQSDGAASALSVGEPARPLFGRLPLARVIPQDVHSVMDYLDGGSVLAGAFLTGCAKARAASWVLGGSTLAASSITDYKLSLAKLVPIEAHEVVDYAFGLSAIAAPFVLGYRKTAPRVAALHVAIGIGALVASLFTDYRAYRGVGRRAAA
jgi:hypothetical protein